MLSNLYRSKEYKMSKYRQVPEELPTPHINVKICVNFIRKDQAMILTDRKLFNKTLFHENFSTPILTRIISI